MYLLSPSESDLSKLYGKRAITSSLPESKGADILAYTRQGLLGIQRKAVPHDFISSVDDGRLVREMMLLSKQCKFSLLLLEGKLKYWPDGHLYISRKIISRFTRRQVRGILLDVKFIKGVDYDFTEDTEDTVSYIDALVDYINQEKHLGLFRRPTARGNWYVPSSKEMHLWILQSFGGIGPTTAERIIEQFGDIPMKWTCTPEELSKVPMVSKAKAKEIYSILNGPIADVSVEGTATSLQLLRDRIRKQ